MKLDRDEKGRGRYAVIDLRKLEKLMGATDNHPSDIAQAIIALEQWGLINYGEPGTEHEFFVLMLKDRFAAGALTEYATRVEIQASKIKDPASSELSEYADQIDELAARAAASPWRRVPD